MATRLPEPGKDENVWGDILNEYLLAQHHPDGTHKLAPILQVPATSGAVLMADPTQPQGITWRPLTKQDVGLVQVDNTADADKPVSNAMQAALQHKASQALALAVAL